MCAIAGYLGLDAENTVCTDMLETMARRGPDEQGIYRSPGCTLLHTRLSIIDPDGGKQPMCLTQNGETFVLIYNGELYNTDEIRAKLLHLGHVLRGIPIRRSSCMRMPSGEAAALPISMEFLHSQFGSRGEDDFFLPGIGLV